MEELSKGMSVFRVMKQVMNAMRHNMKHHFKEWNLTGPQGMMVGILTHYGEMKISDLSEKLGLSNSTVSGIVDRLEKQGLVERIRSKEDRRVVRVSLTPEFKKNWEEHYKETERKFEAMMNKATAEQIDIILKGLNTLREIMEEQEQ